MKTPCPLRELLVTAGTAIVLAAAFGLPPECIVCTTMLSSTGCTHAGTSFSPLTSRICSG
jgi:hypothetical protein